MARHQTDYDDYYCYNRLAMGRAFDTILWMTPKVDKIDKLYRIQVSYEW
jgi:hypothetical protein